MAAFSILGQRPLCGTVAASGSKNAALPILAASILASGSVRLVRVPRLSDVDTLSRLLGRLGVAVARQPDGGVTLVTHTEAPVIAHASLVHRMRASFCVLGPLLARRGRAVVALPGGCRIGPRPVDLHLAALSLLGADIRLKRGYVMARAARLRGARIDLSFARVPTVTGTANVLCAASLARGRTVIEGAAREPEVIALGTFLQCLGADITGLGTSTIEIRGVDQLGDADFEIPSDRIEAGTLLLAAVATGGRATVTGIEPSEMAALCTTLEAMNCRVEVGPRQITAARTGMLRGIDFKAEAYPGIPTDLQAQLMAVLCLAEGRSRVGDHVFPERFRHVRELRRFGAAVRRVAGGAVIQGVPALRGACCTASDLRASAALVLAGLAAEGRTTVRGIRHLDRGYERLEQKLGQLGAAIERSEFPLANSAAR